MNHVAAISPANARLPQTYENAKSALASCANLDECQSWADKAAALASYAKQANDDELMKMATRIRDRAIRRAGELLKQIEPATGKNNQYSQVKGEGAQPFHSRKQAASDAGMSSHQHKQAINVANVPQADFDRMVESDKPPTISQLAIMARGPRPVPQPVVDLKGRDPAAFNRSLHFIAEIEDYANAICRADLDLLLPALTTSEAQEIRRHIGRIDGVHDRIMTRI